jgi:hypothetical protein
VKKFCSSIFIIIIITQLTGCLLSDRSSLPRVWFYTYNTQTNVNDSTALTPVSFLSLYNDGTYTRDFTAFEYGHWNTQNSQLFLISKNQTTIFNIKYTWPNTLLLSDGKGTIANFEGQPSTFSSADEDPFSLQNNKWRIPATHKETDRELLNRLLNHCRFWEMYFTWGVKNKIDYLDVRSTPTLLRMYGNGLKLKSYQNLPETWHTYFFDEEDCGKANDLMQDILEHNNVAVPHTQDKYKMFVSIFQQLEHLLK